MVKEGIGSGISASLLANLVQTSQAGWYSRLVVDEDVVIGGADGETGVMVSVVQKSAGVVCVTDGESGMQADAAAHTSGVVISVDIEVVSGLVMPLESLLISCLCTICLGALHF